MPRPCLAQYADQANFLLREALDEAKKAKRVLQDALAELRPRVPVIGGPMTTGIYSSVTTGTSSASVTDLSSQATLDATTGVTTMIGCATVNRTPDELRVILDPRSWSCSGGPVAATFVVEDDNGLYRAAVTDGSGQPLPELGKPWQGLLYEYARSDVASFENILEITKFSVNDYEICAEYCLYDCLVFMLGALSTPGGLVTNQGHVKATRQPDSRYRIEVKKEVQVKDLTPNDPGNGYDFGKTVNSVLGAALSEWIHDTSILNPVT